MTIPKFALLLTLCTSATLGLFRYRHSPDEFDCGFHCEPNPHVDGLLHYQKREDVNDMYTYEPVSFGARSVTGLLWEMMDALAGRLAGLD